MPVTVDGGGRSRSRAGGAGDTYHGTDIKVSLKEELSKMNDTMSNAIAQWYC